MKAELTWFRNNIDGGKDCPHHGTKHEGHYAGLSIYSDNPVTPWGEDKFTLTVPCSQYSEAVRQEMEKIAAMINEGG